MPSNSRKVLNIWQRRRTLSWELDAWKLSRSGENDSDWQWQYANVNTPPPKNLIFDESYRLPLYNEMNSVDGDQGVAKVLHARRPFLRHKLGFHDLDIYIFMVPDVHSDDNRLIIYGDLYHIRIDINRNGGLSILKKPVLSLVRETYITVI